MRAAILGAILILSGCATPVLAADEKKRVCGEGPVTITVRVMSQCPGPVTCGLQETADGVYVEVCGQLPTACWQHEQREVPDWPECVAEEGGER